MQSNIFMLLIFILPVGCIVYYLLKYYLRNKEYLSIETSENQLRRWKIWISFIGAIVGTILVLLWLAIVWVPEIHLPFIVKILFYILLLPFILLFVIILAFISSLGSLVEAGGSSTRSIIKNAINVFKDEPPKTDGEVKAKHIEPGQNEAVKDDTIELNNDLKENKTIQRWRLAAGILFGLIMLFLLAFYRPALMSGFLPWAYYAFWPLIFVTVIVFIILSQKEKEFKNKQLGIKEKNESLTLKVKRVLIYVVGGALVCIGILGLLLELDRAMPSSINFYGYGLAILFFVSGIFFLFVAKTRVEPVSVYLVSCVLVFFSIVFLLVMLDKVMVYPLNLSTYGLIALLFVSGIFLFLMARFHYRGGFWSFIGLFFVVLAILRIVSSWAMYMHMLPGRHLIWSVVCSSTTLGLLVAGCLCLVLGHLRHRRKKVMLPQKSLQPTADSQ